MIDDSAAHKMASFSRFHCSIACTLRRLGGLSAEVLTSEGFSTKAVKLTAISLSIAKSRWGTLLALGGHGCDQTTSSLRNFYVE